MNRRDFLRRASLIATGVVAADQLELLERLMHNRTMFPSAGIQPEYDIIAFAQNVLGATREQAKMLQLANLYSAGPLTLEKLYNRIYV